MKSLQQYIEESTIKDMKVPKFIHIRNRTDGVILNESHINAILRHGRHGFIVISANRSVINSENPENDLADQFMEFLDGKEETDEDTISFLKSRNKNADKELLEEIRKSGYAYTPVFGGYKGSDKVTDEYEPSYIVYNHKRMKEDVYGDFANLERLGVEWCGMFRQDSFYCQRPGEGPIWLDRHGNEVYGKGSLDFKINRENEEYFTTIKRKRNCPQRFTATFESLGECFDYNRTYVSYDAPCYNSRWRRSVGGEVFVNHHKN